MSILVSPLNVASIPPSVSTFDTAERSEELSGGTTTSNVQGKQAFLQPIKNLKFDSQLDFKIGQSIFEKLWVFSPSSTSASDGLGPLHNARSCIGCHVRGGRGHVPEGNWPEDNAISMLMRLSIQPQDDQHKELLATGTLPSIPEPNYGNQLQDFAMQGMRAEGRILIAYTEENISLKGGEVITLRKPHYSVKDLGYGELHPATMMSVRVANPMIGLGLLEAIDERDILALADPNDVNGDGISGRVNRVWSELSQTSAIGRFGWKAGSPTISQQNSSAFANDMGLSTVTFKEAHYGDCTVLQLDCRRLPDGRSKHLGNVEVAPQMSDVLLTFVRNIAVPKRVNVDEKKVLAGKKLFYQVGCVACHQPNFVTKKSDLELSNQLIWPYSDLLLHDMGEGLADHRSEFEASGYEWRTPPLWGIGKTKAVSGKTEFLHDARAQSLLEAILWHGGEAQAARDRVVEMNNEQRAMLIKFLESL